MHGRVCFASWAHLKAACWSPSDKYAFQAGQQINLRKDRRVSISQLLRAAGVRFSSATNNLERDTSTFSRPIQNEAGDDPRWYQRLCFEFKEWHAASCSRTGLRTNAHPRVFSLIHSRETSSRGVRTIGNHSVHQGLTRTLPAPRAPAPVNVLEK